MKTLRQVCNLVCAALLATTSACDFFAEEPQQLASIEGSLEIELVRGLEARIGIECAGGHGFGFCWPGPEGEDEVVLRIKTDPEIRMSTGNECKEATKPELSVSPDGQAVAYRCKEHWKVVYLGTEGRGLWGPVLESLDWEQVQPFDDVTGDLFGQYGFEARMLLFIEVESRGGSEVVVQLLAETAHSVASGFHHQRKRGGAWQVVADQLEATERERLLALLKETHPDQFIFRADVQPAVWDAASSLEDPTSELIRRIRRLQSADSP